MSDLHWEAVSALIGIIGLIAGGLAFYVRSTITTMSKDFRPATLIEEDKKHITANYRSADLAIMELHTKLDTKVDGLTRRVEQHEVKINYVDGDIKSLKSDLKDIDKSVQGLMSKVDTTAAVGKSQHEQTMAMLADMRRDILQKPE